MKHLNGEPSIEVFCLIRFVIDIKPSIFKNIFLQVLHFPKISQNRDTFKLWQSRFTYYVYYSSLDILVRCANRVKVKKSG